MKPHYYSAVFIALGLLLFIGCGSAPVNHTIVPPTKSLSQFKNLEIYALENKVADKIDWTVENDIMERSVEKIFNLNRFNKITVADDVRLTEKLSEKINASLDLSSNAPAVILKTKLINFDDGSPFLQFMFGLGRAEVVIEFTIIDKETQQEIMKTRTSAKISNVVHTTYDVIDPSAEVILDFVRKNFI